MRALEPFCGIGGAARALAGRAEIVAAVDVDRDALRTYAANFEHPTIVKNLARVAPGWFASFKADLWWMSPPCQPHGIRGAQRDLDDRRSEAFLSVISAIDAVRPTWIALENVPWFAGSAAHLRLRETLDEHGYEVAERELCPTHLGVPNERRRFYLVAGPQLRATPADIRPIVPVATYVRDDVPSELDVDPTTRERFGGAFHVVDRDDPHAVTACFTAAYGRSPVYCGSYLRDGARLRRFDPREIAALLGFGEFRFGADLPLQRRFAQVGNSLSVDAVRDVLSAIP